MIPPLPAAPSSGFPGLLGRTLRLEGAAYAVLRDDASTWRQSLAVVFATALAHGGGALLRAPSQAGAEAPLLTFLFGFQGEILLWLGMSGALWLIARLLLRRVVPLGQVARPLGFAFAPGVGVLLAGALSGAGARVTVPILVMLGVWRVAASVQAVRQGLTLSWRGTTASLLVGLAAGIGLMAAGTAMLDRALAR